MTETYADGFAERLKESRVRLGYTQRQLAAEAEVNHSQLSRYENGTALPRPGMLLRLAAVLGVPVDYLRDGAEFKEFSFTDADGNRLFGVTFSLDEFAKIKAAAHKTGKSIEQAVRDFAIDLLTNLPGDGQARKS